jgi:hypothetical protein
MKASTFHYRERRGSHLTISPASNDMRRTNVTAVHLHPQSPVVVQSQSLVTEQTRTLPRALTRVTSGGHHNDIIFGSWSGVCDGASQRPLNGRDDASHVTARLLKIAGIKRLSGSGIGRSKCTTCAAAANHDRV